MGVTGIHSCYFIVWTLKGIFMQLLNNKLFCKAFVCPAILEFEPIIYCGNCDTV